MKNRANERNALRNRRTDGLWLFLEKPKIGKIKKMGQRKGADSCNQNMVFPFKFY